MLGGENRQQVVMCFNGQIGFVFAENEKETKVQFPLSTGESIVRVIANDSLDKTNEFLWKETKAKK